MYIYISIESHLEFTQYSNGFLTEISKIETFNSQKFWDKITPEITNVINAKVGNLYWYNVKSTIIILNVSMIKVKMNKLLHFNNVSGKFVKLKFLR